MKNFGFLFWAYNAVWILLTAYVSYLLVRLTKAEREIGRLEQRTGESHERDAR